ncbi:hypothetical protein [Lysinibacillus sp. FSL W8-0953]|uniref:hypothetical protein n=1 Tax=Lysinibacillus sp. FSL W8-0953 TaxID=2954640 RepID=UPI0030F99E85
MNKIFGLIKNVTKNTLTNKKEDWGNFIILGVPLLLAIPPISKFLLGKWYGVIGVILFFLIGWFQTNSKKYEMQNLQNELNHHKQLVGNHDSEKNQLKEQINNQTTTIELMDNYLEVLPELIVKYLSLELKLTYTDRISLYNYDFSKELFIQIGRYSVNPEYTKKGRPTYPKDKGFIKNSWQNGSYKIENLPSFDDDPKKYLDTVSFKSKLDKRIIKDLSMKSRSYFCSNLINSKHKAVGVIVIESTNPELPYSESELNEFLQNPFSQLLIEIIESNLMLKEGDEE